MIVKCPITGKRYERFNSDAYHSDDCPFCHKDLEMEYNKFINDYGGYSPLLN